MTSFFAACGSGRSTSVIPPVPAAWSVTTIAFIVRLPVSSPHLHGCRSTPSQDGLSDRNGSIRILAAPASRRNAEWPYHVSFIEIVYSVICLFAGNVLGLIQREGNCPESAARRVSNEGAPSAWTRHRRSVRTAAATPDHAAWPPPSCRRPLRCAPAMPRSARRPLRSPASVADTLPRTPSTFSGHSPAHEGVRWLP